VVVEPLVFDREHGLEQVRRHLLERNLDPLLFEDREDRPVPGVEDRGGLCKIAQAAQRVAVRQAHGHVVAEPGERPGSTP
jgi:hypothetical protein